MKETVEFVVGLSIAIVIAAVIIPLFVFYMALLSLIGPGALALGTLGGFAILIFLWCLGISSRSKKSQGCQGS